jgi:hypothetical protein
MNRVKVIGKDQNHDKIIKVINVIIGENRKIVKTRRTVTNCINRKKSII